MLNRIHTHKFSQYDHPYLTREEKIKEMEDKKESILNSYDMTLIVRNRVCMKIDLILEYLKSDKYLENNRL